MKITTNAGRGYKALTRGLAAAALIGTSSLVMTATATPADAHHGGGGHGWGGGGHGFGHGRGFRFYGGGYYGGPYYYGSGCWWSRRYHRWVCPYY